jgi:NTP pyrophosphatase (non-canonical NTP hydrolase)
VALEEKRQDSTVSHLADAITPSRTFEGINMSFADLEMKVIQWGEARGIVQNSNPMAQAQKTQEELDELITAIHEDDMEAMKDAYGDILVTLIMGCAIADLDLVSCLEGAYNEIKDRKGYLNKEGIFVKEV